MVETSAKLKYILILDSLLAIICVLGILSIKNKATLPFKITDLKISSEIKSDTSSANSLLVSINDININRDDCVEIILDQKNINDNVKIKLKDYSLLKSFDVRLIRYYTQNFIYLNSIVAFVFFVVAIFVLFNKRDSKAANIFHCAGIGTALIMCTTWGNQNVYPQYINFILRFVFHSSYSITPVLFIHFALVFPRNREFLFSKALTISYLLSFLLIFLSTTIFIYTSTNINEQSIELYHLSFTLLRIFASIIVIVAVITFLLSYIKETGFVEKKKIKWLLFGFIIGPLSFVFFWILSQELLGKEVLSEEFIITLQLAVPITFAISILKYHLLDIDLVLNRSLVYGFAITILIILYSGITGLIVTMFGVQRQPFFSVSSTIILALLFQPIKSTVQSYVDNKFFRVQYNFRKEVNRFITDISNYNDIKSLGRFLINELDKLIPVEKIALVAYDNHSNLLTIIANKNFSEIAEKRIKITTEKLHNKFFNISALKSKVEPEAEVSITFQKILTRWKVNLVIPIKSSKDQFWGFILVGNKKSGDRYTVEDIDLYQGIAINASTTIDRIKLQEQLVREKLEIEKLEELNQHKSMFVSSVSHDLKTPLTSIKIFSEMVLENEKSLSEKSKNHLEIIEGETNRLTRLINNVLDFSKIEKGIKEYTFNIVNLNKIVQNEINFTKYMIKMNGFNLNVKLNDFNDSIYADEDAIVEALENILSNSIRFSTSIKQIQITTYAKDNFACVDIEDCGIGIDKSEMEKIFIPYFRSDNARSKKIVGTGLGLSIVKQIVDKHNGKILIKSELEKGSVFSLCFPIISPNIDDYNDEHFNN